MTDKTISISGIRVDARALDVIRGTARRQGEAKPNRFRWDVEPLGRHLIGDAAKTQDSPGVLGVADDTDLR